MTPKKAPVKKTTGRVTPKKVVEAAPVYLDIACGQTKPEGWLGIDIAPTEAADIVHNLNVYPWPLEDNSIDGARCSHYVEHIPFDIGMVDGNGIPVDGLFAFFNEVYRVLKPGAQCEFWAPYYSSRRAMQDPTHRRFISEMTFAYANQQWLKDNGLDHYPVNADFDFTYGYNVNDPEVQGAHDEKRAFMINHYMNAVDDIIIVATSRKPA